MLVIVDGLAQEERRQEIALQFYFPGRKMHTQMVFPLSSTEVQKTPLANRSQSENEIKDDWYEQLLYEVSRVPRHDLLLINKQ